MMDSEYVCEAKRPNMDPPPREEVAVEIAPDQMNSIRFEMKVPAGNLAIINIGAYFSKFGRVTSLNFDHVGNQATGFITFDNYHALQKCVEINKTAAKILSTSPCSCQKQTNIFDVNDNCFKKIIGYLELPDKINFAASNVRLKNIMVELLYSRHNTLCMEELDGLSSAEINSFFELFGHHFHTIRKSGHIVLQMSSEIARNIRMWCPNVTSINLAMGLVSSYFLKSMLRNKTTITHLDLSGCNLHDDDIVMLRELPQIEVLNLAGNGELSGRHLHQLVTLQQLNLNFCISIQNCYFVEMFNCLQRLTFLDVQNCNSLREEALEVMTCMCLELEALNLSCPPDGSARHIRNLPYLQHLDIYAENAQFEELLHALAEHCGNQLETLTLSVNGSLEPQVFAHLAHYKRLKRLTVGENVSFNDECLQALGDSTSLEKLYLGNCTRITNHGVLELLRRCLQLRDVNLYGCKNITKQLVSDVIELLKLHSSKFEERRLLMGVRRTAICESILDDRQYLAAMPFLTLSFESTVRLQ